MKGPSTRRTALKVGGSALCGVLAGCTGFRESRQPVRIERPTITNWTEEALEVDVHVLDDGETVFWERLHATAADRANRKLGGAYLEGFPEDEGKYVVYAHLPFVEHDEPARTDFAQLAARRNQPCLGIRITIDMWRTDGVDHPSVTVAHSSGC